MQSSVFCILPVQIVTNTYILSFFVKIKVPKAMQKVIFAVRYVKALRFYIRPIGNNYGQAKQQREHHIKQSFSGELQHSFQRHTL